MHRTHFYSFDPERKVHPRDKVTNIVRSLLHTHHHRELVLISVTESRTSINLDGVQDTLDQDVFSNYFLRYSFYSVGKCMVPKHLEDPVCTLLMI